MAIFRRDFCSYRATGSSFLFSQSVLILALAIGTTANGKWGDTSMMSSSFNSWAANGPSFVLVLHKDGSIQNHSEGEAVSVSTVNGVVHVTAAKYGSLSVPMDHSFAIQNTDGKLIQRPMTPEDEKSFENGKFAGWSDMGSMMPPMPPMKPMKPMKPMAW